MENHVQPRKVACCRRFPLCSAKQTGKSTSSRTLLVRMEEHIQKKKKTEEREKIPRGIANGRYQ